MCFMNLLLYKSSLLTGHGVAEPPYSQTTGLRDHRVTEPLDRLITVAQPTGVSLSAARINNL